jgi:hypothetical protein
MVSTLQKAPANGKSIAVLPIMDTSHSSFPASHLWKAVQEQILSAANLELRNSSQSEALLRIELKKASTSPSGIVINKDLNAEGDDISKNPELAAPNGPPDFQNFKSLEVAGEYSSDETVSLVADLKVWNKVSKKMLFAKTYKLEEAILSTEGIGTDAVEYLFYRERAEAEIKSLSKTIAGRFVSDYLGALSL